jgi:hypothetical protein
LQAPSTSHMIDIPKVAVTSASVGGAVWLASLFFQTIDIPQMAMTHGLLNAFGFVTCGLVAWSIIKPQTRVRTSVPGSLREPFRGNRV